jgi:predicted ArsR family transcriptional regulator
VNHIDEDEGFDRQIDRLAALGEPVRRALYRYVITEPDPVGREQAATAVGVAPHVAKFHLDKLEADGLLDSEYSRPPGRTGPGAGRPAKRFRRSKRELSISLPERRYDVAGRVMAQAIAVATASGTAVADALQDAAVIEGRQLGKKVKTGLGRRRTRAASRRAITDLLADYGYEPRTADDVITLANCPFHALAQEHTELVCGMNRDLLSGMLDVCDSGGMDARLDPAPGRCCVTLTAAEQPARADRRQPRDEPAQAEQRGQHRGSPSTRRGAAR